MTDLISRQATIDYLMTNMNWHDEDGYAVEDADEKRAIITDLINGVTSAQPYLKNCEERYDDLCDYFNNNPETIKAILWNRKEFKAWLERAKWHVLECDKLARELEKIIHCKDCKYCEHWCDKGRCFLWVKDGIDVFEDGFCNYGERKEERDNE